MTIVLPLGPNPGNTYLQLAQRLRQEVGAAGTGPSSVVAQTGEYKRIVDYLADADQELQQEHDNWKFMVNTFAINTIVGVAAYPATACLLPVYDLRSWRDRTIKAYLLSAGLGDESELRFIDYDAWYVMYGTGPQTNSRPIHYTIGNENELLIGPLPMDVYRISGEYQRSVTRLSADTDVPVYPPEFQLLPVYSGMRKYGFYTGAVEVIQNGDALYKKMMRRMERSQLPRMNHLIPLA